MKYKYDIGMICMFTYNFGNNLTNFALYQVIKDLGFSALLLNFSEGEPRGRNRIADSRFYLYLCNPFSEMDMEQKCYSGYEMRKAGEKCGLYLVASDQMWRYSFLVPGNFLSLLGWAESYKYKMSYATSFGVNIIEGTQEDNKKVSYCLKRFQRISVREKSGVKLLESYGVTGEMVLDPVFLCDRAYYEKMAYLGRERIPQRKFLGIYVLDMSKELEMAIRVIQEERNLYEYRLILDSGMEQEQAEYGLEALPDVAVEEWIAMIANGDFLVTDSFHGMCMALIFHKEFCVVFDKGNWRGYSRIYDLLDMLGLTDRILEHGCEQDMRRLLDEKIDYDRVESVLNAEKERSRQWLIHGLQEGRHWSGNYDVHDFCWDMGRDIANGLNQKYQIQMETLRHKIFMGNMERRADRWKQIEKDERISEQMELVGWGAGKCFQRNIKK